MINKIKELAESFFSEIVSIRRHLHKYPELSFNDASFQEFGFEGATEILIQ